MSSAVVPIAQVVKIKRIGSDVIFFGDVEQVMQKLEEYDLKRYRVKEVLPFSNNRVLIVLSRNHQRSIV